MRRQKWHKSKRETSLLGPNSLAWSTELTTWHALSLTALQDVTKRRWAQCQREDVNLYVGSTYIRDQRRSFNNHVFYPIRLSVGIKDKRYTKLAEAAINYQVMKVSRS